jgi:molybdate transport system substrate-binding protein
VTFPATPLRAIKLAAFALLAATAGTASSANAADIKVLASGAVKGVLTELVPAYEKSSGDKVTVLYGPGGALTKRLAGGDAADVMIVGAAETDALIAQGKIVPGSGVPIAAITIGVAIKKGAARPDISTVDAFKRTLLAAKAIGYRDPATGSTSGAHTARVIEKLGLTKELQARTKLDNSDGEHPELVFQPVVTGETELQFGQITEIVMADGVEVLGPLPAELQKVTVLTASVPTTAKTAGAAKTFIAFLAGPVAAERLKAHGFEPASAR